MARERSGMGNPGYKRKPEGEAERLAALAGFIDPAAVPLGREGSPGCHGQWPADPLRNARGLPMEMVY